MYKRAFFRTFSRNFYYKQKKTLGEKLNLLLSMVLIFAVLPLFITTFMGRLEVEDLLFDRTEEEMGKEEVLYPEILAKQISINMPKEAIKAQSVIARTQILEAEQKGEVKPSGYSMTELQKLWGDQFQNYYQMMRELIAETAGETLQYNGAYIYAAYHQSSAGMTRNMTEYYEKSIMPYLAGADCHEDTLAESYLNVYFWTKEEFLALCENLFPEEKLAGGADIQILNRDSAGYVLKVQVGQTIWEGEMFRKKMNLPSACFEITLIDEDVRIVTMGQGHGFGLSQHMAGRMAEEGKDYREILQYFYKGVSVVEES